MEFLQHRVVESRGDHVATLEYGVLAVGLGRWRLVGAGAARGAARFPMQVAHGTRAAMTARLCDCTSRGDSESMRVLLDASAAVNCTVDSGCCVLQYDSAICYLGVAQTTVGSDAATVGVPHRSSCVRTTDAGIRRCYHACRCARRGAALHEAMRQG